MDAERGDAAPLDPPAPPSSPCSAPRPADGALGCWFEDADGLPAFAYTAAPGAGRAFTRREGVAGATDHWHQVGNDRVIATAHADGRVRLFDGTRGGKWVSEYSAGRVRNLTEGGEAPATAQRRVFGVGYVEAESGGLAQDDAAGLRALW